VDRASSHIAHAYMQRDLLETWSKRYGIPAEKQKPKKIGLTLAGNIPMVGFHDFLCCFISGHHLLIKASSKDQVLIKHLVSKMEMIRPEIAAQIRFEDMLKNCEAYIATGSDNSARYFEYYFGKYPHIIRRNRTSVAILDGQETSADLEKLADDVYLYFGRGCRNVTKLYVPEGYDFVPLLEAFKRYNYLADNNKYKNNYDYQLTILILNKSYFMTNGSILLTENESPFTRLALLHVEYYRDFEYMFEKLHTDGRIQCLVGKQGISFGEAQVPSLNDYSDGIDTMAFLKSF
jgi:hypothetical protein